MDSDRLLIEPGGGKLVDLGGLGVHFKVRGEQTGGAFAVVEHPVSPAIIVEPHVHRYEDELSYVLQGTLWARVGNQEMELVTGSYLWKPRNVLHSFWNPGPESARIIETISPAGFETSSNNSRTYCSNPHPQTTTWCTGSAIGTA